MSTNRGDELLSVMRTRLLTVTGSIDVAWQNQRKEPVPGVEFLEDGFVTNDTAYREVGPSAWGRTEALYRVAIRVHKGTGQMRALSLAVSIIDAFRSGTPLTVSGNAVHITHTRSGPNLPDGQWFLVPVYIGVSFDHA